MENSTRSLVAEFCLDGGAQDATALEPAERPLLFQQLAWHEWQTEQLAVRVGDRGSGFAAVVDDRLCVSNVGCRGVLEKSTLEDQHHLGGVGVAEIVNARVVIAGQHEHLVGTAGFGLDVHRTAVMDSERLVAVERRVQVGNHSHLPGATLVDGVEGWQRDFLVTGTERAWAIGVGLDLGDAWREVGRSLSTLGHDCDPPPGQWIQTQLTHCEFQLRTLHYLQDGRCCELCDTPTRDGRSRR